jgi:hypothetical protein
MRLELLKPLASVEGEVKQDIGAVVARATPGGIVLELGPADGAPHLRLVLSATEALRLAATIHGIANGGGEEILIADP